MLQRAASNAYSWWMASHIRTKQSKWMEQNLQDMEEKVSAVLKLIEEDGDSFIQKANMYYKKRPEIINFVEEFFRAYRALADRYDHLSTELQNANNTIASICPDQVRGLDDDDDFDYAPRCPKMPSDNTGSAPKVPKLPVKELKFIANTKKKVKEKKATKPAVPPVNKSGLTKEEGVGEIDRIQKRILALQTEKEFVKSSYESRLAKYREVENEIKEEQQKVNSLQDEFGEGKVIDDDEARNLMAATAFKSCKETLDKLKQAYERSAAQVEVEQKRITVSRGRVDALKKMFLSSESVAEVTKIAAERAKKRGANVDNISQKPKVDMESEAEAGDGDSEADVPEKIDVLVNKVTSLETTTSSQEALVQRLKSENDELQGLIQSFEEGKANLVDGNQDLKMKIIHLELKWQGIQDLNHSIENQKTNLQSRFIDAHSNLDEISHNIKPVENLKTPKSSSVLSNNETKEKPKKAKAGKEFLKPKAGKEFLKPRVTTSPAEAEPEKGSEEHVATNKADASKELNSVPVSANADASKELNSVAKSAVDGAGASKELNSVAKSAVDGVGASKELNSVPVSANAHAYASKEVNSVAKSAVDGVGASKELNSVPVSANAHAYASKEVNSVAKSAVDGVGASKELNSVPVSANADAYASKELNSVAKSTVDGGARASKELNSVPKFANDGVTDASKELHSIPTPANEGIECPKVSETSDHLIAMAKVVGQASSLIANKVSKSDSKEHELAALSLTLEETKKKLMEVETNHQNELFEITLQLKELKNLNAKKDEVIRSLRLKLSRGKPKDEGTVECQACSEKLPESETKTTEAPQQVEKEEDNDSIPIPKPVNDPEPTSVIEEKFRTDIDELLEENLDFWYRFSSTLCEIQKYQTGVKDLEAEVLKLEERQKNEGSSTSRYSAKSDVRPLYKHLREMQTELSLWIEKSMSLKDELKNRSASLCEIQEEITKALKASAEDEEFRFTSFQAAKFQGEILNMKQENNRVGDELQAGLELATSLQRDAERALAKLSDDWGLSGSRNRQGGSAEVRSNVPLRSFIFGVKQKKQKTSIFSVVQPALQKKQNKPGNSSSGK
ncbi:Networked 2D [Hibiscus trionum]|uniref:Networked 2D n=1 Tax=Hibiscus trionum TaxID=183268 RepID=A0A9W7J664_HIBTR|nr:Networked 2D [Hibiscus trionum]